MGYNQVVQCSDLHIVVLFFLLLCFVLFFSAAPSIVLNSLRASKEQTQKQNSNVDLGYLRLIQVEMGVQIIFMILLIKKTQEIKLNEINCIYY